MNDFLNPRGEILMHRGVLPHWQQDEVMQFITFRLGDALPRSKLSVWQGEKKVWLDKNPEPWSAEQKAEYNAVFTARFEKWLDAGYGKCLLRETANRRILEDVLRYDHERRVIHIAWIVMPNHVHLLFKPKSELSTLIRDWKSLSARRIDQGAIWQRDFRDTLIRNGRHFAAVVRYIRRNRKGLAANNYSLWESPRAQAVP